MTLYVIEIEIGNNVWKRVGRYYRKRETARSWVTFVKKAWHVYRARVVKVTVSAAG